MALCWVAIRRAAAAIGWPTLRCEPAAELDDGALRRELANAHALGELVSRAGMPRDRDMLALRLAELDGEYLSRFPAAALTWPWPR
ncbi:hypothetical protein CS0771_58970 [Catellatospora sp. IY07-71]|uniref:hypothetical protein n=1 Tax=Catellatospora sp. IY07-71 TaxID=2728827 RepID=UPI001BB43B2A|nr:hypothetical protein [Catellatospora sp. IY07-71]BCJ76353.1 hypothetical protein CS0771_58970 [Catellatospora sp. IY07-71]